MKKKTDYPFFRNEVNDQEKQDPLIKGKVIDHKRPRPNKINVYLIRTIISSLNRNMSAAQIAWVHNASVENVRRLAKKLRAEGFKIPEYGHPGPRPFTKLYAIIQQMKKENPDLLTDDVGCVLVIDDKEFHLNYREKKKLLAYLPRISNLVRELPTRIKGKDWVNGRKRGK